MKKKVSICVPVLNEEKNIVILIILDIEGQQTTD